MAKRTMPRKPTRAELEEKVQELEAYQEAFFSLEKGKPDMYWAQGWQRFPLHDSDGNVTGEAILLGASRASGGVLVCQWEGGSRSVVWAEKTATRWAQSGCPYSRDVGRRIHRAISGVVEARLWADRVFGDST